MIVICIGLWWQWQHASNMFVDKMLVQKELAERYKAFLDITCSDEATAEATEPIWLWGSSMFRSSLRKRKPENAIHHEPLSRGRSYFRIGYSSGGRSTLHQDLSLLTLLHLPSHASVCPPRSAHHHVRRQRNMVNGLHKGWITIYKAAKW